MSKKVEVKLVVYRGDIQELAKWQMIQSYLRGLGVRFYLQDSTEEKPYGVEVD